MTLTADTSYGFFETGDLSEVTTSGTDITVTASSPITGGYSALITITDTSARYIELALPSAGRGDVRCDFDLSGLTMANGDLFRLVAAQLAPQTFWVDMRQLAGVKQLRVTYRSGGADVAGAWVDIPANVFTLRVAFVVGASSGSVRADANNVNLLNVSGINNADAASTVVRVGTIIGLDAGTSGTIKIDNFWVGPLSLVTEIAGYQSGRAANDLSPVALDDVRVEMEFSGRGSWEDIAADVLSSPPLSLFHGIKAKSVADRVAGRGRLVFSLRNDDRRYSPESPDRKTGFDAGIGARVVFVYDGVEYVWGRTWVSKIEPAPGKLGARRTDVTAHDFMRHLAEYDLAHTLPVLAGAKSGTAYDTILDNLAVQPDGRSFSAGDDTFSYVFTAALGKRPTGMAEIANISRSELGYFFDRGDGTVASQTRGDRLTALATAAWINDRTMHDMQVARDDGEIPDTITAMSYPNDVSTTFETVFNLETPFNLTPGETRTMVLPYSDPNSPGRRIACASIQQSLTANTHYKFGRSSGDDNALNANLGITFRRVGTTATILEVTNNGAQTGWVNLLALEGKVIRRDNPQQSDEAVSGRSGNRNEALDLPYVDNLNVARAFAQYAAFYDGSRKDRVRAVKFTANRNHEAMRAALGTRIGDRVRITEYQTGLDGYYFVNSVGLTLKPGRILEAEWGVEFAPTLPIWTWDRSKWDGDDVWIP